MEKIETDILQPVLPAGKCDELEIPEYVIKQLAEFLMPKLQEDMEKTQ